MSRARPSDAFNDSYSYDGVSLASSSIHNNNSHCGAASSATHSYDSFSVGSDTSSIHPRRPCPLCPSILCSPYAHRHRHSVGGGGSSQHSYREVKREMEQLVRSKDELFRAEMKLQAEKQRGRWLLTLCAAMVCLCLVLFMDQLPSDWRGIMVDYLEKDDDGDDGTVGKKAAEEETPITAMTTSTGWDGTMGWAHDGTIGSASPTPSPT